ncbi:Zn-ribbon domain-containing OB-fold protein [Dactylosporangium sp. NPDC050688]|uniref:Zn-ribbon domain-containing OB-fold protein n=1 Tax=Dactylosporangium sp. NPDC050688 TaxID=3157217 RepID=UPI0033F32CEC
MSDLNTPAVEGRPVPLLDAATRPYWEATQRGELLVQECGTCGHRQFYPRSICVECGATPGWLTTAGRGTVHTFSVVRQSGAFPFNQWTPYAVAIVELDEGPRIMGNVVGCDVDDVHIGQRVEVEFVALNDEASLPFWRPAGE